MVPENINKCLSSKRIYRSSINVRETSIAGLILRASKILSSSKRCFYRDIYQPESVCYDQWQTLFVASISLNGTQET